MCLHMWGNLYASSQVLQVHDRSLCKHEWRLRMLAITKHCASQQDYLGELIWKGRK